MSAIDAESVPRCNVRVRRRRYGESVFLILDNYYHELDEAVDAIWQAADGQRSVADIAARVARRLELSDADALAAVRDVVRLLAEQSLLVIDADDANDADDGG